MNCPDCDRTLQTGASRCSCGWATPTKKAGLLPSCLRCGIPIPGARTLYGLCASCVNIEQTGLAQLARDLSAGRIPKVNPAYAPAYMRKETDGCSGAAGERESGPLSPLSLTNGGHRHESEGNSVRASVGGTLQVADETPKGTLRLDLRGTGDPPRGAVPGPKNRRSRTPASRTAIR